jgi:hypothetical protein
VGYSISQNQSLRDEINHQLHSLLELSKEAISQMKLVIERLNSINRLIKADKSEIPEITDFGEAIKASSFLSLSLGNPENDFSIDPSYRIESETLIQAQAEYDQFWQELKTHFSIES